jgi:hypothetical protein
VGRSVSRPDLILPGLYCPTCKRVVYDSGGGRACHDSRTHESHDVMRPIWLNAYVVGRSGATEITDEMVERGAEAAFFCDDLGGHIGGRWTWATIPDEGRENYRAMVRDVLEAALNV